MPIVKLDVPIPTEVSMVVVEYAKVVLGHRDTPWVFASDLLKTAEGGGLLGAKRTAKLIRELMDRLGADFVVRREEVEAAT